MRGASLLVPVPWVVSGGSAAGLAGQAARLAEFAVRGGEAGLADVGWSLAVTRAQLPYRAVVLAAGRDQAAAGCGRWPPGREPGTRWQRGKCPAAAGGAVLVFPGQGGQWPGMAAALLAESPAFAGEITAVERELAGWADWSLWAVLSGQPGAPGLDQVTWSSPPCSR